MERLKQKWLENTATLFKWQPRLPLVSDKIRRKGCFLKTVLVHNVSTSAH